MGLFKKLFGKPSTEDDLLSWGGGIADEAERVYRTHASPLAPSGSGLLRVRLMASAFTYCAFYSIATTREQEHKFLIMGCQIAAYGLLKPGASPTVPKTTVQEVSMPFINQVIQHILGEVKASQTSDSPSPSFRELQALYESCLHESIGERHQAPGLPIDLAVLSEQVIAHLFKSMWMKIAQLKSR